MGSSDCRGGGRIVAAKEVEPQKLSLGEKIHPLSFLAVRCWVPPRQKVRKLLSPDPCRSTDTARSSVYA
ncbi:hypothetical protein Y032_0068g156 [Ancylostoma ceylanicum]|uniref:Uncharacterized protein n=1 Tax=Ancylostoma ceylanicum TaxID=53326 RepID=A0A016TXP1_9BILA|nr:hypothetical protein Y032_0068g156 [Ancylostoma ceylanicum]